jgi:hypothetical protein
VLCLVCSVLHIYFFKLIHHGQKKEKLECKTKVEIIETFESGVSIARVCEEYGVKKQTVSDIRKRKYRLTKCV